MEDINNTSESEQMYLVTIARLGELIDECPIPIAKVAEILEVTPISANQMIRRLQQMGFINYTPYKGVEFTDEGWQTAKHILRTRRLWEVFLVEHLHYPPKETETLACRLEHAISAETTDRLAEFLGWPQVSPMGKPIPQSDAANFLPSGLPLSALAAGRWGRVNLILAGEVERAFLAQAGLTVGAQLKVLGCQQNGDCLIQGVEHDPLHLSAELAEKILVEPQVKN